MKFLHIFIALFIFFLPACKSHVEYVTADKTFILTLPKNLKKIFPSFQAVLQCVSKDYSVQMMFFSHRTEDLAESANSRTLLEIYIDDLSGKINSFTKSEDEENYVIDGKNIQKLIYTGIRDNKIRDYYIFSSVDFYDNPEIILTSIQIIPVGRYRQYEETARTIIETARINK